MRDVGEGRQHLSIIEKVITVVTAAAATAAPAGLAALVSAAPRTNWLV